MPGSSPPYRWIIASLVALAVHAQPALAQYADGYIELGPLAPGSSLTDLQPGQHFPAPVPEPVPDAIVPAEADAGEIQITNDEELLADPRLSRGQGSYRHHRFDEHEAVPRQEGIDQGAYARSSIGAADPYNSNSYEEQLDTDHGSYASSRSDDDDYDYNYDDYDYGDD